MSLSVGKFNKESIINMVKPQKLVETYKNTPKSVKLLTGALFMTSVATSVIAGLAIKNKNKQAESQNIPVQNIAEDGSRVKTYKDGDTKVTVIENDNIYRKISEMKFDGHSHYNIKTLDKNVGTSSESDIIENRGKYGATTLITETSKLENGTIKTQKMIDNTDDKTTTHTLQSVKKGNGTHYFKTTTVNNEITNVDSQFIPDEE